MADKKKKNSGSLPENENIAYRDYRGKEHAIKGKGEPKAPDGVAGDWK